MAFAKKRVQDRKDWLKAFEPGGSNAHHSCTIHTILTITIHHPPYTIYHVLSSIYHPPFTIHHPLALQPTAHYPTNPPTPSGTHIDYNVEEMTYDSFINKELVLFSVADNQRSIPSLMDGFKPSQRKVLFKLTIPI